MFRRYTTNLDHLTRSIGWRLGRTYSPFQQVRVILATNKHTDSVFLTKVLFTKYTDLAFQSVGTDLKEFFLQHWYSLTNINDETLSLCRVSG